jgi:hypothetical protein
MCPPEGDAGANVCLVFDVTSPNTVTLAPDGGTAAPGGYLQCCFYPCLSGRRPAGLAIDKPVGDDVVGRYLAVVASLEAASVLAFDRLTRELVAHGAPAPLCDASRRAARDERRHARITRRLAKRFGSGVPGLAAQPHNVRNVEAIAAENAVEGCVRETFGAACAMIQAERATNTDVRRAMDGIARDETRHAMLAWAVASWLDTKLDAGARAKITAVRRDAVDTLIREAATETHPEVRSQLGVPTAAEARLLIRQLDAALWAHAAAA